MYIHIYLYRRWESDFVNFCEKQHHEIFNCAYPQLMNTLFVWGEVWCGVGEVVRWGGDGVYIYIYISYRISLCYIYIYIYVHPFCSWPPSKRSQSLYNLYKDVFLEEVHMGQLVKEKYRFMIGS